MKNIINATLKNMTKDVLDVIVIAGMVLVITIGAVFGYYVDFDENSNVDSYDIVDTHVEAAVEAADDMLAAVLNFNEAFDTYNSNELTAIDGNG
jgi:hypothetical protein